MTHRAEKSCAEVGKMIHKNTANCAVAQGYLFPPCKKESYCNHDKVLKHNTSVSKMLKVNDQQLYINTEATWLHKHTYNLPPSVTPEVFHRRQSAILRLLYKAGSQANLWQWKILLRELARAPCYQ